MKYLLDLNPDSYWLEIEPNIQEQAWLESNFASSASRRQKVFLNILCQKIILPDLQSEFPQAKIGKSQFDFWELGINGIAIKIDGQSLIIIPSQTWDLDELRIEAEWVDIPELVADYYIGAQIDTEAKTIQVWGYTTHEKLKEEGNYTQRDRSYVLERDRLTKDLNTLWLTLELFPQESVREPVKSLPQLKVSRLSELLEILSNPQVVFPRRMVAFEEWGALLANESWRNMLLQRCRERLINRSSSGLVNLSRWFEEKFESGWQAVEELISPQLIHAPFRGNEIKRAKQIDLGFELSARKVSLMITAGKKNGGVNIQASVYPTGEQIVLPANLKLIILTETGEIFKQVTARSDDQFIRYKFDAEPGDRFKIKIQLGLASISQDFQV